MEIVNKENTAKMDEKVIRQGQRMFKQAGKSKRL